MAFSIRFTNDPDEYPNEDSTPWAVGRITAGDLDETFLSSLYEWDRRAYEAQWLQSLERLIKSEDRAVLIASYANPSESHNIHWWALYRGEPGVVHIQDHMPSYDQFDREFRIDKASTFLGDRVTVNEEGNSVSEWNVSMKEIELFLAQMKQEHRTP